MRFVVAPFIVAALLLAGVVAPVHAQVDSREGIALQNQIYQLRQELRTLQDQMARGGGGGSRQAPSLRRRRSKPAEVNWWRSC